MARPLWFAEIIKQIYRRKRFLYMLAKIPILGKALSLNLFGNDALICLPRDATIPVNQSLEEAGQTILPSQVVEHFIEAAEFHWIMNFCMCREGSQCKHYPRDVGCLFLGEAARGINPGLGRQVSKEEAREYLRKCREAGFIHNIGRNKIDALWLGVSPGDKLLTICNCCECCCIAGGSKHLHPEIASRFYNRMPGVEVKVSDRCVGCGTCTRDVCFMGAISLHENRSYIDQSLCRGCGRCIGKCPRGAIEITINDTEYVKKSIDRVSSYVDVSD